MTDAELIKRLHDWQVLKDQMDLMLADSQPPSGGFDFAAFNRLEEQVRSGAVDICSLMSAMVRD